MSGSRGNTVGFLIDLLWYARGDLAAEIICAEEREQPTPEPLLKKAKEMVVLSGDAIEVIERLPRSAQWRP